MAGRELKVCAVAIKAESAKLGLIEGYGATFEEPDSYDWYGDIIDVKAFDEDLAARGPQGSNEIVMLWSHRDPFGMPLSLSTDSKGLRIKGEPTDTEENVERMKYVRHGVVRGLSIAYEALEVSYLKDHRTWWGSRVRKILKAKLYEISPTPQPANPMARMDDVKSWRRTEAGIWEPDRRERTVVHVKCGQRERTLEVVLTEAKSLRDELSELLKTQRDGRGSVREPEKNNGCGAPGAETNDTEVVSDEFAKRWLKRANALSQRLAGE